MTPEKIIWRGPESTTVQLDEDGVTLLVQGKPVIEENELRHLIDIINEAMRCRDEKTVPIPAPPARTPYADARIERAASEITRAVKRAISDQAYPF